MRLVLLASKPYSVESL